MFEPSSDLMIEAAQTIEKGVMVIEERGWCQQVLEDSQTGAVCLFGGLQVAMEMGTSEGAHTGWTGPNGNGLRKTIVQAMLDEVYPDEGWNADNVGLAEQLSTNWNDRVSTTVETVTTAMRAAAQSLYKSAGVA